MRFFSYLVAEMIFYLFLYILKIKLYYHIIYYSFIILLHIFFNTPWGSFTVIAYLTTLINCIQQYLSLLYAL